MYPYLLKRKLIWRFVQLPDLVTTSQDRFLYYLSVWKIFSKNSFLFSVSRGVPLDCGCKGRYFSITDQTFLGLFFKKNLIFLLMSWFSMTRKYQHIYTILWKWHFYVAKHEKWQFREHLEDSSLFPSPQHTDAFEGQIDYFSLEVQEYKNAINWLLFIQFSTSIRRT